MDGSKHNVPFRQALTSQLISSASTVCKLLLTVLFFFVSTIAVYSQNLTTFDGLSSRINHLGTPKLSYKKNKYTSASRTSRTIQLIEFDLETGIEEIIADGYDNFGGIKAPVGYVLAGDNFESVISFGNVSGFLKYVDNNGTILLTTPWIDIRRLYVSNFRPNTVYLATYGDGVFVSKDAGLTWPTSDQFEFNSIPDSLFFNFPLVGISPHEEGTMFGYDRQNAAIVRSTDLGNTEEAVLEVIDPELDIQFSSDPGFVAFFDKDTRPGRSLRYNLHVSHQGGSSGTWNNVASFSSPHHLTIDAKDDGAVYVWRPGIVYRSIDRGLTFDTIFELPEGQYFQRFTALDGRLFFQMSGQIYELINDEITPFEALPVHLDIEPENPFEISLSQNFPNPFNPTTTINYRLQQAGQVSLIVFDVMGRQIMQPIANTFTTAGEHSVSIDFSNGFSSGVYFYTLTTEQNSITRTMTLLK